MSFLRTVTSLALVLVAACNQQQDLGAPAPGSGGPDAGPANVTPSVGVLVGKLGGDGNADDIGSDARFSQPCAVAGDGDHTLYVLDNPLTGQLSLRAIDLTTGAVTTVARSLPGNPLSRMWIDGPVIYFSTGSNLGDAVWTADVTTGAVAELVGSAGAFEGIGGITGDHAGHLYVADGSAASFYEPAGAATIRQIDLASLQVTTLAGGPVGAADGVGSAARFAPPVGLIRDPDGGLVFGGDDGTIRRLAPDTGGVSSIAALGATTMVFGSTVETGPCNTPVEDLARAPDGQLLVLGSNRLCSIDATGTLYQLTQATRGDVDGVGDVAATNSPHGLWLQPGAQASEWTLYVADMDNDEVRAFEPSGSTYEPGVMSTVAGAALHRGETDGAQADALLAIPIALASDPAGDLYTFDDGGLLRRITPDGTITSIAIGGDNVAATHDRVLVSNGSCGAPGGCVTVVDPSGSRFDDVQLATGTATFTGGITDLGTPLAIAVADDNTAYLSTEVSSILKLTLGPIPTVSPVATGLAFQPFALALDGHGALYVSDVAGAVYQVTVATGEVALISGPDAGWQTINALAYDPAGFLYVSEQEGHRVRAIRLATDDVVDLVGSSSRIGVKLGGLPGGLSEPSGLALLPSGDLAISDEDENVVLVVHAPAVAARATQLF